MLRNVALTAIGAGFVALAILPMALGELPWDAPDPWVGILFFGGCAVVGIADIVQDYRPARASVGSTQVALKYDQVRLLALGVASAGWLAAGIVGLGGSMFPAWLAWVLIAFAGTGTLALLPAGLDGRAKITVDAEGIADYRQFARKIPWSEIEAISYGSLRGMPSVALRLRDPARHKQRTISGWLGYPADPVQIIAFNLTGSLFDVSEAIRRFAPPALWSLPYDIEHFDEDDGAEEEAL